MENAIEALEIAGAAIMLALALQVFMNLNSGSKEGERCIMQNISYEWLIVEGESDE